MKKGQKQDSHPTGGDPNCKSLVIMGMHRSGTSLVAGICSFLGIELGNNVEKAAPDNISGFWEYRPAKEFNQRLLESMGLSWDDIRPVHDQLIKHPKFTIRRDKLVRDLAREFSEYSAWGIKDPRICRLLPIWKEVLGQLNCDVKYLIVFRNPLEVAESLRVRNEFSRAKSLLLWLRYVLESEFETRGLPRAFVSHDGVLNDWQKTLSSAFASLELNWPNLTIKERQELEQFIQPDLKHHNIKIEEIELVESLGKWTANAYQGLEDFENGKNQKGYEKFDRIREELASADYLISDLIEENALEFDSVKRELEAANSRLNHLEGINLQKKDAEELAANTLKRNEHLLEDIENVSKNAINERQLKTDALSRLAEERAERILDKDRLTIELQEKSQIYSLLADEKQNLGELNLIVGKERIEKEALQLELNKAQKSRALALEEQRNQMDETLSERRQKELAIENLVRVQRERIADQKSLTDLEGKKNINHNRMIDAERKVGEVSARLEGMDAARRTALKNAADNRENSRAISDELEKQKKEKSSLINEIDAARNQSTAVAKSYEALEQRIVELTVAHEFERKTVFRPIVRAVFLALRFVTPKLARRWLHRGTYTVFQKVFPNHPRVLSYLEERAQEMEAQQRAEFTRSLSEMSDGLGLPRKTDGQANIVFLSIIDWEFRYQRPQHLATEFARLGNRVTYISPSLQVRTITDVSSAANDRPYKIYGLTEDRVILAQLVCHQPVPVIYTDMPIPAQQRLLSESLATLCRDICKDGPTVLVVQHPFWRATAIAQSGAFLVYDCMDHHAGFTNTSSFSLNEEKKILEQCDLLVSTSEILKEILSKTRDSVLIRNAADVALFADRPLDLALEREKPTVGYIGAIAEWFDIELIEKAAKKFPDWNFVMIGATVGCNIDNVEALPNVEFLGEVPYVQLPVYLHAFDVCIIPFLIIELTLSTNPVKVYEYLSAGKPVVCTALPELVALDEIVHVASDHAEFIEKLSVAMSEKDDEHLGKVRANWAAKHTWKQRVEDLSAAIQDQCVEASVVVLTCNNLDFTKGCLSSLETYTNYSNWELIIVDNASTDGTVEFLRGFAQDRTWVKLILNETNKGFAEGNNQGMREAVGDVIVLLNNDTYVTSGWLLGLMRHLQRNEDLGLVGPVTNNIGNEAKIDVVYKDFASLPESAFKYTSLHAREVLPVRTVAFFCVAIKRSLFESIGALDTDYGIGFFEDDDYCRRAEIAGYSAAIAEDVFVHHHLSASFDDLGNDKKQELFDRNKIIYEKKWGPWVPHTHR